MPTYRQILSKAWQITWRNPILWFFGLFVSILGGGGEIEILLKSPNLGGGGLFQSFFDTLAERGQFFLPALQGLPKLLITQPFAIFIILLSLMVIFWLTVFVIWLVVVGQTALIKGTVDTIKSKRLNWLENFRIGLAKFWPIFSLNAVERVVFWFLFGVLGFFATLRQPYFAPLFGLSFLIFIPLIIILAFIIKYAICAVVLKNQRFLAALKSALRLFFQNWLLSLEIACIWFLIFALVNSFLVFFVPLIYFYSLKLFYFYSAAPFLAGAITFILFAFVQAFLAVFYWATWTIVFEILTSKKIIAVSRLTSGFKKIFG